MFVVMNRFTIHPDHWQAFEARFRERAGLIDGETGFMRNLVLRPVSVGEGQHIVMTFWRSREDFEAWTHSESFRQAHVRAGQTPKEWFLAPTRLETFETVCDSLEA